MIPCGAATSGASLSDRSGSGTARAAIYGCAGPALTARERRFFEDADPVGFILFARNCENPDQVRALVEALRATVAREDVLVLIDQEGGRVSRLKPPHWPARPAAERFVEIACRDRAKGIEAARLNARLMARDLADLGINVDCAPVLDVLQPETHDVIGDRAYGEDPEMVATLGRAVAEGLMDGGVLPVIKHIPGHGRATVDSHEALPVVDADRATLDRVDFAPFRALADMPLAMTAHITYRAIDPQNPATLSPRLVADVIRGAIGFDGVLMSDDLSMKALAGTLGERVRRSLGAGCDVVLHCNGRLEEMEAVREATPPLLPEGARRLARAFTRIEPPRAFDGAAAERALDALLARA